MEALGDFPHEQSASWGSQGARRRLGPTRNRLSAEKPGFSGGEMLGRAAMALKKQRLSREKGREMVQERGLVPSSFLQTGARLRTPTKGVILHSSQEGLSGLPGRHAHHTQCHSACPDSLSGVCHTKGDFITR